MANEKRIGFLQDPTVFSDLRDLETAERRKLDDRRRLLHDISSETKDGAPRKRYLTREETAELKDIDRKLSTDDVVDPMFKAVQVGLQLQVGDHKNGLMPSQQWFESIHAAFAGGTTRPDLTTVITLAGLEAEDKLIESLPGFLALGNDRLPLLEKLIEIFDKSAPRSGAKLTTRELRALAAQIKSAAPENSELSFYSEFGDVVRRGLVSEAESLVDWLAALVGGTQADFDELVRTRATKLTSLEKNLAGVVGILSADNEQPPPFSFAPSNGFDPIEERQRQKFGKALFAAQGEYSTNRALFDEVLPILISAGAQGPFDEVKTIEWARTVRYLAERGITASEPQLTRRVNEALNNIQNVGSDLPPSDIPIDLPDLEADGTTDHEIVGDNIRALQPGYFAGMFEELKVFQVVDKLVELFQNGILPIGKGEAGNNLFKYWKETATRVSEAERRSFYARTLGFVGGDDGGFPNREFNDLWMRFVSGVSSFIRQNNVDDLLRSRIPGSISQQQVRKAGRDLAANLSLHGYGMAHFMATELQKQIKDVIKILSDPDIKNSYGARDMWQVIDQVAALELGGSKNSVRYRTMAASGAIILGWLAKKSRELASTSFGSILDMDEIRHPAPRPAGTKASTDPTDFDLVNACEQWLAVTGTQEDQVQDYSQPKEAPNMTSKPIQIPSIARETLEAFGVPAMSYGGNGSNRH